MKCQKCKEREANVQIMQQELGKKPQTIMLCDICAREIGVSIPTITPGIKINNPFAVMGNAFQTTFGLGTEDTTRRRVLRCPMCKLSFDQFRKEGFLGCPSCYEAFGVQLDPVFCRTQMGKKHVGRMLGEKRKSNDLQAVSEEDKCTLDERLGMNVSLPQERDEQSETSLDKTERMQRDRMISEKQRRLEIAVEKEEYMEAARLRDEIAELKQMEE